MKSITEIKPTSRVQALREYYINNSPLSVNKDMVCWKSHRSMLLYIEGWQKAYGAPTTRIRRSMAEAYMLANTKPIIVPHELITGQANLTDFTPEEQIRYDRAMELYEMMPERRGRADHMALDYQLLLDKGITGIIEILNKKIANIDYNNGTNTNNYEFYLCAKLELEGLLTMCESYAAEAKRLADNSSGKEKEDYKKLYSVVSQVPAHPARNLHEALQSIHMFTWSLYGIYSFGKPDYSLYPYYRRDIDNGTLTKEQAQELIDCFFLMSVPNMSSWAAESLMLGGRDYNGNLVENELTWHYLTAIRHTHVPDPNVGFCVVPETSKEILDYVAKIITEGHCQPQIWNSDEVKRNLMSYGFDETAANMFTISTCAENTPIGCSAVSITSPYINLLGIFLKALDKCDNNTDFDSIFAAFEIEFKSYCKEAILQENLWQLERARNSHDPVRASVLIHDCIERGLPHENGGARYNHLEPDILGMQNVSESFNIIKKLVFNEKFITLDELKKAISVDFDGYEALRNKIVNKTLHFGTDDVEANEIAKRVADTVLATFAPMTTPKGARIVPGAFSYRDHTFHGAETGASPDGRRAGKPLNDGSCPVQGYDNLGPTASLSSTVSWQPARFIGGTSVNVKLNSDVAPDKVVALIKGYIAAGGSQLQFNIVDTETLIDAQKNPENYRDLLVRIGGYSDFFVTISKELQEDVIARSQNKI